MLWSAGWFRDEGKSIVPVFVENAHDLIPGECGKLALPVWTRDEGEAVDIDEADHLFDDACEGLNRSAACVVRTDRQCDELIVWKIVAVMSRLCDEVPEFCAKVGKPKRRDSGMFGIQERLRAGCSQAFCGDDQRVASGMERPEIANECVHGDPELIPRLA